MAQRFAIDAVFRAIDKITDPMRSMSRGVARAAERMERKLSKVNGAIAKIRGGAAQVGKVIAAGAAIAAAGLTHAVNVGADFEQVLIRAGAKFGGIERGSKAFDDLADAAIAVSSTTEFMGSAAAGSLEFMSTAGESAAVSMGALANFADFATANSAELARAADIASDSITALGLDVDASGNKFTNAEDKIAAYARVNDLLTTTATGANLTLDQVFETVKKSGSTFAAAGQDVETFLAATQAVSGVIKGAEAGTGLRIVMKNVLATTRAAGKAMKRLRIQVLDRKTGAIKDLPDILDAIIKKTDAMSEGKRKRIFSKLFGEAEPTALALLANLDLFREKIDKLKTESGGKVKALAAIMRDSASNAFKTLGSTIEAFEIGVFKVIRDDVVVIVKEITKWVNANKELFSERIKAGLEFMRDNFDKIAKIGPRLVIFAGSLMALAKALAFAEGVMAVLAAATTLAAGSIGLIALGVVAAIASLALLIIFWDEVVDAGVELIAFFDEGLQGAIFTANAAVEGSIKVWDRFVARLKVGGQFFADMWGEMVDVVVESVDRMMEGFNDIMRGINQLTGTKVFDVKARVETEIARPENLTFGVIQAIGDASAANGPPLASFEPPPAVLASFEPLRRSFAEVEAAANAAARPENITLGAEAVNLTGEELPQLVSTTTESLVRTFSETLKAIRLDVNIKDPGGVVDSVEQSGNDDGSIRVVASGDL